MNYFVSAVLLNAALLFISANAKAEPAASTLQKVRHEQSLTCGVNIEESEYTMDDAHGNRAAFDNDFCRAVAAAAIGSNAHVMIKPYRDEASSVKALQAGEIDLIASGSVNVRSANGSLAPGKPILFDYQGLLVDKTSTVHSAKDLAGKKVCFLIGTEIEVQLSAYMARNKIAFIPGPFSEEGEMETAFLTRNCDAVTADVTQLAYERSQFRRLSKRYQILSDVIAMDPLAPVTRSNDAQWTAIVNWTNDALVQGEALHLTQNNVSAMDKCDDIVVQRLLGGSRGWAGYLGLDDRWAARAIAATGNYGELFERNLGPKSPMGMERGLNRLWSEGGMLYANPIR